MHSVQRKNKNRIRSAHTGDYFKSGKMYRRASPCSLNCLFILESTSETFSYIQVFKDLDTGVRTIEFIKQDPGAANTDFELVEQKREPYVQISCKEYFKVGNLYCRRKNDTVCYLFVLRSDDEVFSRLSFFVDEDGSVSSSVFYNYEKGTDLADINFKLVERSK